MPCWYMLGMYVHIVLHSSVSSALSANGGPVACWEKSMDGANPFNLRIPPKGTNIQTYLDIPSSY